jgi:enamine deaminase RidA (YjgF/YER057c/UK114 family)
MSAEERLKELGHQLPPPAKPGGNYVRAKRSGNMLYVAGHIPPLAADGTRVVGKVGADLTVEQGYEAARSVGLNLLATLRDELGSLDRVVQIVKVFGMVNCSPDFLNMPQVVNGCSDLLVDVFGTEAGSHARSAVGMAGLPWGVPVEIEMVVEIGQ